MCSELFRIPSQYSGVPIFGVGLLLVVWLVGGGLAIFLSGKRTGWSAETWGYLPGFILGAVGIAFAGRLFPEGLPIRGFGVMVLTGSVTAIWLLIRRARQVGISSDVIMSLSFGLFIGGILGARLFYVIEYWDTRFQSNNWSTTLLEIVKFTEGGLVFYGSMIGGGVAYVVLTRKMKLPALALADLIAPSLLVGLAFGRLGCLLNGCCYGGETDKQWAVTFPKESVLYSEQVSFGRMYALRIGSLDNNNPRPIVELVDANSAAAEAGVKPGMKITAINGRQVSHLDEARQELMLAFNSDQTLRLETEAGQTFELPVSRLPRSRPVHPTQIYSSVNAALLAWVLWSFYPVRRRDGEVIALLVLLYPTSRFLLEMIRIDESAVFGTGLSISQNISLILFVSALAFWIYLWNQPREKAIFSSN
jgi:phosphatidylglycerol:prolipoprotein diacylglycerol transferase